MANTLTLDPKRWSYQDYANFLSALTQGDFETVLPIVVQIIVGWTYDVPFTPTAYLQLPFTALPEIALSVNETLKVYIEGLDTESAKINMAKWNMQDYFDFRAVAKSGDVEAMEKLMRKVSNLSGVKIADRLSFEQGALIAQAINEATKTMFSTGK